MHHVDHPGSYGFHSVATLFTGSTTGGATTPARRVARPPLACTGMTMATELGIAQTGMAGQSAMPAIRDP
jgi:hypothetical protein